MEEIWIREAGDRAEIRRKDEERRWQWKFSDTLAEIERVKMAQEKEVIERRIEKVKEDHESRRKMWEALQKARKECIKKDNAEIYRRLTETSGFNFIANPACISDDRVGDVFVSGAERAPPGDGIRIKKGKDRYSAGNSCVDNHPDGTSNKSGDDFVPLQFEPFAGEYSRYAISPELASKRIPNVDHLLDALNKIFNTNIRISYPGMRKTLEYLINKGHDLGVVYAHLQVIWPAPMPSISSKPFTNDNPDYVIGSPELASKICQDVDELLRLLNMSFDTAIPRFKRGVEEVLSFLVGEKCRFGDICAYLRYTWPRTPELEKEWLYFWKYTLVKPDVWEEFLILQDRGRSYEKQRQESLRDFTIQNPDLIKPRRLWNLYAHRVIPFEFSAVDANNYISLESYSVPHSLHHCFSPARLVRYHPVSHSWTGDMAPVDSAVNAHEWPVPLPRGVTLEAVRNELLNLGVQYVWLDVVCLRQKCSDLNLEFLRRQEWKIDVPTIGKIYEPSLYTNNVIRYLNGLGKAFRHTGWEDKRHWSQRAWTLQEVSEKYIEAGLPKGIKDPLEETSDNGIKLRDHLKIGEIRQSSGKVCLVKALAAMQRRHSQNPVDKVWGLSTLLGCSALPVYSESLQSEWAWDRLLTLVDEEILRELLFIYPLPGENGCHWRPSWRQLMQNMHMVEKLPGLPTTGRAKAELFRGLSTKDMILIRDCLVSFDDPSRRTVLIQTTQDGNTYRWRMLSPIQIQEDIIPRIYTLVTSHSPPWSYFILCKRGCYQSLEKVALLRCSDAIPQKLLYRDIDASLMLTHHFS